MTFKSRTSDECLPVLMHFIQKGNTTVYEWRTGIEPSHIEKTIDSTYNFGDQNEEEASEEINFDIDIAADTAEIVLQEGDDIDWGDFDSSEIANLDTDPIGVDYDIDSLRHEICIEEAGVYIPTDNKAKGNDAYVLLEWLETRNLLLNDLFKVIIVLS